MPKTKTITPHFVIDEAWLHFVKSPFALGRLPRKTPNTLVVIVSGEIEDADARRLREYTRRFRHVSIRIGLPGFPAWPCTLRFLRHFPDLQELTIRDLGRCDEAELIHLPKSLPTLYLCGSSGRGMSLEFLMRLSKLRRLGLEQLSTDLDVVGRLKSLRELELRSITVRDLGFLLPHKGLRSLEIILGGTNQLDLMPKIGRLQHLALYKIYGLSDVSWLSRVKTLQFVDLQALRRVTSLPSLKPLLVLRRVRLDTMKGLFDLQSVAFAPQLEDLELWDMRHLTPAALQPFVGHPTLRAIDVHIGARRTGRSKPCCHSQKSSTRFISGSAKHIHRATQFWSGTQSRWTTTVVGGLMNKLHRLYVDGDRVSEVWTRALMTAGGQVCGADAETQTSSEYCMNRPVVAPQSGTSAEASAGRC